MAKSPEKKGKFGDKGLEFYRDFNVGTAALAGGVAVAAEASVLFLTPEVTPIAIGFAAINLAQAGVAEVVRRIRKSGSKKKAAPAPAPA